MARSWAGIRCFAARAWDSKPATRAGASNTAPECHPRLAPVGKQAPPTRRRSVAREGTARWRYRDLGTGPLTRWTREPLKGSRAVRFSLIVFENGHISGALAELIRSTRAPTKDRLNGKVMGGNPVFRGTRVPVHMLAELVPSPSGNACARTRYRRGSGAERSWLLSVYTPCKINAPPEAQEAVGRGQELSGGAPRADES